MMTDIFFPEVAGNRPNLHHKSQTVLSMQKGITLVKQTLNRSADRLGTLFVYIQLLNILIPLISKWLGMILQCQTQREQQSMIRQNK